MRVLSVNVGLPRDVARRHRADRDLQVAGGGSTARAAAERGRGRPGRLVDHGGEHRAVYVYDRSACEHWSQVLGRDDVAVGHFGENLTVEGMPDDEVCIGDR